MIRHLFRRETDLGLTDGHDPTRATRPWYLSGILLGSILVAWGVAPKLGANLLDAPLNIAALKTGAPPPVTTPVEAEAKILSAPARPLTLDDPPTEQRTTAAPGTTVSRPTQYKLTVQPGDNLSKLFARFEISSAELAALLQAPNARERLENIRSGDTLILAVKEDASLTSLEYRPRSGLTLAFHRGKNGFETSIDIRPAPDTRLLLAHGVIASSFYQATSSAGVSQATARKLKQLFQPLLDLGTRVHPGDTFRVLYRETADSIGNISERIEAAEVVSRGKTHQVIRYTNTDGQTGSYSPDGQNLKIDFLRYPVAHRRISSPFSKRRWHPKLHRSRAHLGVDFSAPAGTPIKAAGNGRVVFAGRQGGYGKTVEIQHSKRDKTVYAHLSRFARNLKKGSSVKRGQVIGYVGRSGLATGPHLHYEFHRNQKPIDPMKMSLPSGPILLGAELQRFRNRATKLLARLGSSNSKITVAASGTDSNSHL